MSVKTSDPHPGDRAGQLARPDGDRITVGDISGSVTAIGRGTQATIQNIQTYIERDLSQFEIAEKAQALERKRLAEALTAYIQRLQLQAESAPKGVERGNPYKALLEYDLGDAALFYGRSQAIEGLSAHLARAPLTVLHAESGAGKTSLLKAGLMPRLLVEGDLPLYLRPYKSPAQLALKQALLPNLADTPGLAGAPLQDFLRRVTDLLGGGRLVVIIDQFEELFTVQDTQDRAVFVRELGPCLGDTSLPVRWVFALRGEWLSQLGTFRPQVRNPFANEFLLRSLNRAEAREVILEPARQRGVAYQEALVEDLLDDLGRDEIAPPQLQLACSALFEALDGGGWITQAMYQNAGGASGILRGHLERVLSREIPREQRQVARRLLEALVTSQKRRALRGREELADELGALGEDPGRLDQVLERLVDSRLLRVEEPAHGAGTRAYELAHDYLLEEIELDPAVQARKAAQELLAQEVDAYRRHKTLLSADKLVIIESQLPELVLGEDGRDLLEASRKALRRQRRLYVAGAGAALVLLLVAVVSGIVSVGARASARNAQVTVSAANLTSTAIASDVEQARTQQADSQAEAQQAVALQSTSQANAQQAASLQATSEAAAAAAEAREQAANLALQRAFEQTGIVPVGASPGALAWDGANLWVANREDGSIQQINPLTGIVVQTIPAGDYPNSLFWDGANLWVTNYNDNTVMKMDPYAGAVLATIPVGDKPTAMAWDGETLWVANSASETLQGIDPQEAVVTTTIHVDESPSALAWDGANLWFIGGVYLYRIDPRAGAAAEKNTGVGSANELAWDGSSLWVSDILFGELYKFDPDIDKSVATIEVGQWPSAMFWDGANLWVANQGDDTVMQIDTQEAAVLATIPVGGYPGALAWDGDSLWVANSGHNTVQKSDPLAEAVSKTVPTGDLPGVLAWDGTSLWVTNVLENSIQQIDPRAGTTIATIEVGLTPSALAFDGTTLWVANTPVGGYVASTIMGIDPVAGAIAATITVDGEGPSDLAWDGANLWLAVAEEDTVQQIDTQAESVVKTIPVGDSPIGLAWDGGSLWVANQDDNTIQEIDPQTGAVAATIPVGEAPVALAWDGSSLWVANRDDDTLQQIDPKTNAVMSTIPMGLAPSALAWDSTRLWVANTGYNTVQLFDTQGKAILATIPVGIGPTELVWDGASLWVTISRENAVQQIHMRSVELVVSARRLAK
jgi:YVTN family beta-propeller protein